MSDPKSQDLGGIASDIGKQFSTSLPQVSNAILATLTPTELAQLEAAQAVSPGYAQLMSDLYAQYAPGMAQTGARVEGINRMGAAQTDANIMQMLGPQLGASYRAADAAANPEVAAARTQAGSKLSELLGSINLNNANPEAERLVSQEAARTGNTANTSATSTVANALQFGGEMKKRQDTLSNAIALASGFMQTAQGNFNPVANATTRGATNTGSSQFTGVKATGDAATGTANNYLNAIAGLKGQEMDINANRRDTLDRATEFSSAIPT